MQTPLVRTNKVNVQTPAKPTKFVSTQALVGHTSGEASSLVTVVDLVTHNLLVRLNQDR